MAALVTLVNAKLQLHIDSSDSSHDADITLKMQQASDIILDYLKDRLTSIASVSAANPAVVTTTAPHSLTSGVSHTIAGTSTTPTINGSQIVTVTGPTTFTVPVNVIAGQSSEAGTVGTPAWTDVNVPTVIQSAVLLVLTHLYENRGDNLQQVDEALWEAIGRLLMRRRDPALA